MVALEIVREAVFERLHEELPYKIVIRHVSWRELGDGSVRVEHALMVANNSQRKARARSLSYSDQRGEKRPPWGRLRLHLPRGTSLLPDLSLRHVCVRRWWWARRAPPSARWGFRRGGRLRRLSAGECT